MVQVLTSRFGTPSLPAVEFRDLRFTNAFPGVYDGATKFVVPGTSPIPTVVDPISQAMRLGLYAWNRMRYIAPQEEGIFGNAWWFFNLPKIKPKLPSNANTEYTFTIRTPATGPTKTTGGTAWYVWDGPSPTLDERLANPVTTGDPRNVPYGVITLPFITASEAEANALAAMTIPPMSVESRAVDFDVIDTIDWRINVGTFRGLSAFPLSATNEMVSWDLTKIVSSVSERRIGDSQVNPLVAFDVDITCVLKTLALSLEVRNI